LSKDEVKPKKSFVEICKDKEEAGMARTNQWVGMWQDALRYFLSDQLHGRSEHKDWDWVILNYIWPSIMQETAKLSRNFKVMCSPIETGDDDFAEAFGGFLNFQWGKTGKLALHQNGMRIEQLKAILCGKLYGYRVSKILWDDKVWWSDKVFPPRWEGEVKHRLWRPSQFWASDSEYIDDGDCGTVRYVELEYAKHKWPGHDKKFEEASLTYKEMQEAGGEHISGQSGSSANYPSADTGGQDKGVKDSPGGALLDLVLASERQDGLYGNVEDRRYCKISEQYLKDYTETKQKKPIPYDPQELLGSGAAFQVNGGYADVNGNPLTADNWPVKQMVEWSQPKFPNGRVVIRNEDEILNPDESDQVYPHSVWPFVVTPHYMLPFMWQGTDAVTLYKSTQDHINVTVSHLVNNMKMFGNPRIAVEQDALAENDHPGRSRKRYKIFSGAGSIIRLARGGLRKFKIIDPSSPSPTIGQLYSLFAQEFKNLTGLQDIGMGKKTGGNTTATETQFLAISSNDRIKLQNVFEENWALRCMNLVAEMDQYYYDVGRVIRIIGDDKLIGAKQITEKAKTIEYDLNIEAAEGLPYDEEKRIEKHKVAYEILGNPMPNPMLPEMLRVLDIPSWQKLIQKHSGWQMYVQFAKLYEAVKGGQMDPQQAVQVITQQLMQLYVQEQKENGNANMRTEGRKD
jgi:hypothetical protein